MEGRAVGDARRAVGGIYGNVCKQHAGAYGAVRETLEAMSKTAWREADRIRKTLMDLDYRRMKASKAGR